MNQIGRRIYYDLNTGNVIIDTGERKGSVVETTLEEDIHTYVELSQRNRESFDVISLEYGAYAQDFRECNGYRIDVETQQLEFSYPDSNKLQEPIYQQPLTEQIVNLRKVLDNTMAAVDFLAMSMA